MVCSLLKNINLLLVINELSRAVEGYRVNPEKCFPTEHTLCNGKKKWALEPNISESSQAD